MRAVVLLLVLLALLVGNSPSDARRKGEENWKQRYRQWKESEERNQQHGALIGTDEAAAAKLYYREEHNSMPDVDALTEKEMWRKKIEEKKQRQAGQAYHKKADQKPASEITAWHEEKWRRKQEHKLQVVPFELQRPKRQQSLDFGSEDTTRVAKKTPPPPPHTQVAAMARYIVHNSDWAAVAYYSQQPGTFGLPMADIFSISDGLEHNSTGIPYMYISPRDTGVQDLAKDSRCSLAMSLAQGDYCKQEGLDPEDPRCGHVFLTGKLKTVKNGTDEWARAEELFFTRHPKLRNMPKDHNFRFVKLKIGHILVQDYFGGPAQPTLAEYFAANPNDISTVSRPVPETEAELLPGASTKDSVKWIRPVE